MTPWISFHLFPIIEPFQLLDEVFFLILCLSVQDTLKESSLDFPDFFFLPDMPVFHDVFSCDVQMIAIDDIGIHGIEKT